MGLVTSSWERPIQGVSQQPPKVRLPGQCSVQENAVSSVISGLVKRPGTQRIARLTASLPTNTAYYYYNRGAGERYVVAIAPNSLPRVFDIEGNELTVENGLSNNFYITSSNPREDLRLNTISDFTFIANRKVIPEESSVMTPGVENVAILNMQFADYGRHYVVTVDGNMVVDYETPDGSESDHIKSVDTSFVSERLLRADTGGLGGGVIGGGLANLPGFSATRRGNTIILKKNDGTDFSISTEDGADGRDLFVIKNSVKEVSDLPLYAPDGYRVQVLGSGSSNDDTYWLVAESSSADTVRWVESSGPNQSSGFSKLTMPHVLIRDRFIGGKAVFRLEEGPWEDRSVGDEKSNPMPSFIQEGVPITSVGTFQNRLYFTAGESVVMSRSNYFFQFFRQSVRTALDDDPIDIYADTNRVNYLQNSSVLDGDVVFFSANGQFLQSGSESVTKENATLQYASTFENIESCPPVASGDVIFFAFEYGLYTGIREFYTDSFTDTKRARPITDHVDEYIVGTARQLSASTNKNQLIVLGEDARELYLYNWLWQGQERVQSSWSKWTFTGDIKYVTFDNDNLFILIDRGDDLELEYIPLGDPDDTGVSFPVRLDRRVIVTAYREGRNWRATLPFPLDPGETLVGVRASGCRDAGVSIDLGQAGTSLHIAEDIADEGVDEVQIILGVSYRMLYQPTMPFIKDRNDRVIDTDRLTINDVNINYDMTGKTQVIVENEWGSVREYEFNGRRLGAVNNIIGFAPLRPGQFSFPVRQESDRVVFRLVSDSHLPFQLRDMEWRGRFKQRGRRV